MQVCQKGRIRKRFLSTPLHEWALNSSAVKKKKGGVFAGDDVLRNLLQDWEMGMLWALSLMALS